MKNSAYYRFKNLILTLLFAALLTSSAAFGFSLLPTARAESGATSPQAQLFLPSSDLEYMELESPVDAYSDDDITAIIQNGDPNSLLIYYQGKYSTIQATQLTGVNRLNKSTLIFSSAAKLRMLDLNSYVPQDTQDPLNPPYSDLEIFSYQTEAVRYFDLNSKYLVTAYQSKMGVFSITDAEIRELTTTPIPIDENSHVAINDNNEIFFVNQNQLFKLNASNLTAAAVSLATVNVSPSSKIVANNEYVFYICENKLYRLSVSGGTPAELSIPEKYLIEDYDLGKIENLSGLTFRNENLLITDNQNCNLQEFNILDNDLIFTGFAIAANQSAYNRINKNATDIERYGNTVAILDSEKLTVITNKNATKYSYENYQNYKAKLDSINIQHFSLGNGKLVFSTTEPQIKILDFSNANNSEKKITLSELNSSILISDICYQSGKFFVLVHTSTSSIIYSINELNEQVKEEITYNGRDITQITVDVFGNIYLANDTKLYKYTFNATSGKYENTASINQSGIKKLATDLGGKVYMLTDGALSVYDGETVTPITLLPHVDGDEIKSFAMNFDEKSVYLLYKDKEYVCVTDGLDNYALSEAQVADDIYVTTANQADLSMLKVAKVNTGANVYSVARNGVKFDYKGLITAESEYVYICDVTFDGKLILAALAGQNGVVLVNITQLELTAPLTSAAPQTAFVTTDVNAYFIPIITKDADYALTDDGNVRLAKETLISPTQKLSVLDNEFYYASVTVDGQTYKGYIPVNFTVEVLAQDFVWNEYTIEKISATDYFTDENLSVKAGSLSDGSKIRLISIDGKVAKVAIETGGEYCVYFVNASAIKNEPNIAVRNILIILAVAASVCGTASYFVMRKKD